MHFKDKVLLQLKSCTSGFSKHEINFPHSSSHRRSSVVLLKAFALGSWQKKPGSRIAAAAAEITLFVISIKMMPFLI